MRIYLYDKYALSLMKNPFKSEPVNLEHIRHTLAHLLAAAVREIQPDALPTIGPAIDNGFYYDFEFSSPISDTDLPKIETIMHKLLPHWEAFTHYEVTPDEARKVFSNNPYKLELIAELEAKKEPVTLYYSGQKNGAPKKEELLQTTDHKLRTGFLDLCRGGHIEHPSKDIKPDAFALSHIAGAYWRGNEKNKMLTRIYGLAFPTKKELDDYRAIQEEAKKRDHRKIAKEQELLVFSDLVGSGMPMYTPKGNVVRNAIIDYSRELNTRLGFGEVHTPNINKAELFKISGHYDQFKQDMLTVHSQYVEDEMFLKPMNCPQHTQIYASRPRSYRDLPIRYSDFANLYRDERPGELSGLTRLRAFAQDDGHIFCREDQIEEEIAHVLDAIQEALATYKINGWMRLSLRDPNNKTKYLGTDDVWERSQRTMRSLLREKKIEFKETEGEAAFYGPKIDVIAVDTIGREWQISTIQLDFNMPARFKLTYNDKDGKEKTPVMIHRALIGSPDRFLGVLIEHYAGAFPLWLSPVQVNVLPIAENHHPFATEVTEKLKKQNIRAELDDSSETLGKKIRAWKLDKTPYALVIGDDEVKKKEATLESRDNGKLGSMTIEALIEKLKKDIDERS